MRGKIRVAMVMAITIVAWLFPAAVTTAQTTDPIVARWRAGGAEVTISAEGSGFSGVVTQTQPGYCEQVGDQVWTITSKTGSTYSGTANWYNLETCSLIGQAATTWELQDSDSVLRKISTDPADPSNTSTIDWGRAPAGSIEGRWRGTGDHLFDLVAVTGQPHSFETRAAEDWTLSNGCKVLVGDVIHRLTPLGSDRYEDSELTYSASASNPPGDRNDYCVRGYGNTVVVRYVVDTGAATEEDPSGEYLNIYVACSGCFPTYTWSRVGPGSTDASDPIEGRWRSGELLWDIIAVTGQSHSFEIRATADRILSNGCKVLVGDVIGALTPLGSDRYEDSEQYASYSSSNPPGDRNDYCVRGYYDPVVRRYVVEAGAMTEENAPGEYLNIYYDESDCSGCAPIETWSRVAPAATDTIPPHITEVSDRPDPFTPNGDGHKDRMKVYFTLDEKATVTFSIFNAQGTRQDRPLRVDLEAGENGFFWDGRNKKGTLCPAGTYTYQLKAVDSSGNKMVPPVKGKVKLKR